MTAIHTVTIRCDGYCTPRAEHECSGYNDRQRTRGLARAQAESTGWVTVGATRGMRDYCPTCAPEATAGLPAHAIRELNLR